MHLELAMGKRYERRVDCEGSILNMGFGARGLVRNLQIFGSSEIFFFGFGEE
jgi:hypothetical protein